MHAGGKFFKDSVQGRCYHSTHKVHVARLGARHVPRAPGRAPHTSCVPRVYIAPHVATTQCGPGYRFPSFYAPQDLNPPCCTWCHSSSRAIEFSIHPLSGIAPPQPYAIPYEVVFWTGLRPIVSRVGPSFAFAVHAIQQSRFSKRLHIVNPSSLAWAANVYQKHFLPNPTKKEAEM